MTNSNDVYVIDMVTNTPLGKVDVGVFPYGLRVSPSTGRVFVANNGEQSFSIIEIGDKECLSLEDKPPPQVIEEPEFEFRIDIEPSIFVVTDRDQPIEYDVSFVLLEGVSQQIEVKLHGVPNGIQAAMTPESGTPPFDATLTLILEEIPSGNYSIWITGAFGRDYLLDPLMPMG